MKSNPSSFKDVKLRSLSIIIEFCSNTQSPEKHYTFFLFRSNFLTYNLHLCAALTLTFSCCSSSLIMPNHFICTHRNFPQAEFFINSWASYQTGRNLRNLPLAHSRGAVAFSGLCKCKFRKYFVLRIHLPSLSQFDSVE